MTTPSPSAGDVAKLVERLRNEADDGWTGDAICVPATTAAEAATALESLSRELAEAREDAERNLTDARKRCSELTALVDTAASIFENCSVESGMCCCGEPMEGHPDPMSCGHSATDHGGYVSVGWHNRARSVLSREKEAAR